MSFAGATGSKLVLIALITSLFVSCAKTGMPPGGAEDKAGPTIISHFPEADAVNVSRRMTATLEFSEPVNRASVESALFFAPEPGNRLKYHWRGNFLDLIFLDSLAENRTYVISTGSAIKDQRGNPAGKSFTIAFATGAQIDRGRLSGIVADYKTPQSVSIWAYDLASAPEPNPTDDIADYALQPDDDGVFRFGYLRLGRYRVFAVHDKNLNRTWDMAAEMIGVPPWDVMITDTAESYVSFRLSNQDTGAVSIVRTKEIDARRIELRLSRETDSFQIVRFLGMRNEVINAAAWRKFEDEPEKFHVFSEQPLTPGTWQIEAVPADSTIELLLDSIVVRAKNDTSKPKILKQFPDGKRPATSLQPFRLEFDEPVYIARTFYDSAIVASTEQDTLKLIVSADTPAPLLQVEFMASPSFSEGKSYTLQFDGRWITDLDSNYFSDSLTTLTFAYFSPDSLGSVRGTVAGSGQDGVVTLRGIGELQASVEAAVTSGQFHIDRLAPGDYIAMVASGIAINDDHHDQFGSLFPLTFSTPFIFSPDTISVRARWETETTIRWDIHP